MSFDNLKKNRGAQIDKLVNAAQQMTGGKKNYGDDTEWKPKRDDAGNGYKVIRFLPAPESKVAGVELPWVQYFDHFFKGPTGRYYVEKSLTTIGEQDYISEKNSELWNTGDEGNKDIARKRKRRLHYVANVLIIKDTEVPENEGKVMKYVFGKKIFDKINDLMQPPFPDEDPCDPFDLWEGADFRLKIRMVDKFPNYDKSDFAKPAPLFDGDEAKLRALYDQLHDIGTYVDPTTFKSYDELKRKFIEVTGENEGAMANVPVAEAKQEETAEYKEPAAVVTADEDDDISYFTQLAQD